jgi:putative ABC transport system ATP-binding protein
VSEARLEAHGVGFDAAAGPLFDGVDLAAFAGQLLVVTGAAGSGKSVFAAILAGALAPARGSVSYLGRPMPPVGHRGDRPSFAPQDGALVAELTATESIGLPMQARRVDRDEIRARTEQWLRALGLTTCADRPVSELSGGQRQRVSIARALASSLPAVVLDEPTAELDAANRAIVRALILAERDRGAAMVVISHDPDVEEVADRSYQLTSNLVEIA